MHTLKEGHVRLVRTCASIGAETVSAWSALAALASNDVGFALAIASLWVTHVAQ